MRKAVVGFWTKNQGKILQAFLALIVVIFIGILIGVYLIAKKANPIILDEKGKPINTPTADQTY
ncbi:MAG: hypothetical protein R2684_08065 [Pyrinomonadaceae bacterium]